MSRALAFLMRPLDVALIFAYFVAVMVFGLLLAGRQRDATDYFLGRRGLPWWALMFAVVATETSALTVISVPGLAARGDLTFLQIAFGYLVGRIGVAALLLPGYFQGTQDTAYQRLEHRFGPIARRTASGVFLFTRALADCVRIFATAIPLAIITHWSLPVRSIPWHRSPHRATPARGAKPQGCPARAHRLGRLHHGTVRAVPAGGNEPVAGGSGSTRHAGRCHLPDVHRDPSPDRNRRTGGGRHSGRGDEQPCVGR